MKRTVRLLTLLASLSLIVSCAANRRASADVYSPDEAQRVMLVEYGTVESVRPAVIEGPDTGGEIGRASCRERV